ncbi:MAG: phosphoribosylglycinamide formyltransferase [Armatimonadetes bacterium]|nr:phosphoribosylglycinamide formyltransferase [Armatimonadota bacterium]
MSARVGILVGKSGRGSNMTALITASMAGLVSAEIVTVVSPSATAPALLRAEELGVPSGSFTNTDQLLQQVSNCDFLCLAGFLSLIPNEVLEAFPNRILNIHPALLPKFGGKGMYGMRVHEAVIHAGEKESGCTVHYVDAEYDHGQRIMQAFCPVLPSDTPQTLAERVLTLEHATYPAALELALRSG